MKFRILIEPDEDGMLVATVPSLRERGEPIPPTILEEVIDVAV